MKPVLLGLSAVLTIWAIASFLTGFEADFASSTVAAMLCLGLWLRLDWLETERRRAYFQTWERREREAGPR